MKRFSLSARALLLVVTTCTPLSLVAQNTDVELPDRPDLPEWADSNDAGAYYNWGIENLERRPGDAADAFYWASRLAPQNARALYARRIALLMDLPGRRLIRYMNGRSSALRSEEILAIDSLGLRARVREPVFYRELDRDLTMLFFQEVAESQLGGAADPGEIRYWLENMMRRNSLGAHEWNAWLAYNDRNFPGALEYYEQALRRSRYPAGIHVERGHIFALTMQYDSAQASFREALSLLREAEDEDEELVRLYQSKAMLEFTTGVLFEKAGDLDAAREAHGRALLEDLSFYPSHLHLGSIAMARGDTTQAIAEFTLAAELEPDDVTPALALAVALRDNGDVERAATEAHRAIAVEPFYAVPYLLHGTLMEALGDAPAALRRYTEYLDRTTSHDPRIPWVNERIELLESMLRGVQ